LWHSSCTSTLTFHYSHISGVTTSIFTTYSKDVVEETNRAAAAKRNLAAAIRDPTTSARRLQELEEEDKRASAIYESSTVASKELQDFLERVKALLPEQRIDEGKEE
jgi:deoxyribodipyrimidine photolyase